MNQTKLAKKYKLSRNKVTVSLKATLVVYFYSVVKKNNSYTIYSGHTFTSSLFCLRMNECHSNGCYIYSLNKLDTSSSGIYFLYRDPEASSSPLTPLVRYSVVF